jgi:RNA polymerase sigma-70 factor (ECF subfamily)
VAVRAQLVRSEGQAAELLLEHRAYVLRLCRILLRDSDESEDAAQQTLLNAHRALADGVRPLDGRAWLAEIARNECRSRMRRAVARTESPLPDGLPAAESDPVELVVQQDLLARLRDELEELPDRQRRAVLLREFRGLSYDELATEMAETGPAVESLLRRARRRLTKRLVPAAFALDWARSLCSRIRPGPAASEAAAAGSGAALVAKLAAAGVVAVGVSVGGADLQRPNAQPRDASPAAEQPTIVQRPQEASVAAFGQGQQRHGSRSGPSAARDSSESHSGNPGHGGREGDGRGPSPSAGLGPAGASPVPEADPAPDASGSTSSGPGPGTTTEADPVETEPGHGAAEASEAESAEVEAIAEEHGAEVETADHSGSGRDGSGSGSDDGATDDGSGHSGSGSSGSGSSGSGK